MPELSVYVVDVVFTVPQRRRLTSWSGVFAGKTVYDSLSLAGTVLAEGGLFRVSPVYPAGGNYAPISGALAPGEEYWFRAVFWGSPSTPGYILARGFLEGIALQKNVRVEELSMREEQLELPPPEPSERDGGGVAASVEVAHGATFYRFHGAVVSYPSPWRMVASIARRASMATGLDYRELARRLQPCLELAVDNTKKTRIMLSHGKQVRVFVGKAIYHLACPKTLAEALEKLLQAAKMLGLGGSPGLGLGEVRSVEVKPPKHQLPQPLEPWADRVD